MAQQLRHRSCGSPVRLLACAVLLACMLTMAPTAAEARRVIERNPEKVSLMVRGSRAQMLASGITPLGAATNGDSGDDIEIMDAFSKLVGGVDEVRRRGSTGWRRVQVNTDKDVDAVIKELQEDGFEVEQDSIVTLNRKTDDPAWSYSAFEDAMERIQAPQGWDIHIGNGGAQITVCVIDTGIDFNHEDLRDNMHPKLGYNPVTNQEGAAVMDTGSHGTHCAGTVAARGDNGKGVAGVAWDGSVKLLGCNFIQGDSGRGSDAAECMRWCRDQGAKITSNSWGGGGYSRVLEEELKAYEAWGGLAVFASGNDNTDIDRVRYYPVDYNLPSMINVNAINPSDDRVSGFTNYGATATHLFAPGERILSTVPGGKYAYKSGTSMAAPHVAGAAALLWSYRPSLSTTEVKALLLDNVDKASHLGDLCQSGGVLNVRRALLAAQQAAGAPAAPRGFASADMCRYRPDRTWYLAFHKVDNVYTVYKDAEGWCAWWFSGRTLTPDSWYELDLKACAGRTSEQHVDEQKENQGFMEDLAIIEELGTKTLKADVKARGIPTNHPAGDDGKPFRMPVLA